MAICSQNFWKFNSGSPASALAHHRVHCQQIKLCFGIIGDSAAMDSPRTVVMFIQHVSFVIKNKIEF